MANITVQNHFTIRRLRTGDTLFLTIEGNGVPLIQTVNASTGISTPDWTTEANQPVLTPKVNAASGNPVALSAHKWMYNGSELTFTGTTTDGWTIDSSERFKINGTTGALRIVGNLGGADNLDSDVLQYSCVATAGEIDYPMTRSIDIQILGSGAGAQPRPPRPWTSTGGIRTASPSKATPPVAAGGGSTTIVTLPASEKR